ncbi:MAG TPA: hypothetical protein VJ249_04375 [Candidatus Bathyarchaeia archaeon]|nr:hypothetical protein [Candidatus Bathyarchaeia archaeon]
MRSDYGLYGVAVMCFILGAIFASSIIPGWELTATASMARGVTVTVVFMMIGIIAAAVGYSARPKAMIPPAEPTPMPTPTPTSVESTPPAEESVESVTPPPTHIEEISVSPEPSPPQPTESSPPAVEAPVEAAQPTPIEAPAEAAVEEKPKPARRRRKKATA